MSLEPCGRREALLTEQTAVWLLPGVCAHVHVEVGGAPEPPVAVGTGIGSFSRVDAFVNQQLSRGEKGLFTLRAPVGPLPCVSQVMPDERG